MLEAHTPASNNRRKCSGHSSFLTCASSPASVDSPSNSIISGGTRTEGNSKGGDVAGSRSVYSEYGWGKLTDDSAKSEESRARNATSAVSIS